MLIHSMESADERSESVGVRSVVTVLVRGLLTDHGVEWQLGRDFLEHLSVKLGQCRVEPYTGLVTV